MEPKLPPGSPEDAILLTFEVPREQAGLRLDRFIQWRIPRLSRTKATLVAKRCAKWPDGRARKPSDRVEEGEIVIIVRPAMNEPETPQAFGIIEEDEAVLVVDKPAGLPIHPSATYYRNTLLELLKRAYPDGHPMFAHRLDKETSGIVICGKGRDSERALKQSFEAREPQKTYLAIVHGTPNPPTGIIDARLSIANSGPSVAMMVAADGAGKSARTAYEVLVSAETCSLVRLKPHTGRQHQLRVHLSHIGNPIIGDKLYGPSGFEPFYAITEGNREEADRLAGFPRHALHAYELALPHPTSRANAVYRASVPEDLRRLWRERTGTQFPSLD